MLVEQSSGATAMAWHGTGRQADMPSRAWKKRKYQGPGPHGMPEKEHVGVTGPRGQGTGEAEAGTPQRYSQGLQQQQDNNKNVVLQLVKILKVKTSKLVLIYRFVRVSFCKFNPDLPRTTLVNTCSKETEEAYQLGTK